MKQGKILVAGLGNMQHAKCMHAVPLAVHGEGTLLKAKTGMVGDQSSAPETLILFSCLLGRLHLPLHHPAHARSWRCLGACKRARNAHGMRAMQGVAACWRVYARLRNACAQAPGHAYSAFGGVTGCIVVSADHGPPHGC